MKDLIEMKKKDGNPDMDAFQFCIKALSLKNRSWDTRVWTDHLLIHDGFTYGSDGKRIHRAKLAGEYREGLYRIFIKLKTHICIVHEFDKDEDNYPDFTDIVEYGKLKTLFNKHFGPGTDYLFGLTGIIRALPDKETVNPEYLSCFDDYFDVKIKPNQIILENETRLAIVMAMHNG